jgi:cysteinyl-tRNA synthetase
MDDLNTPEAIAALLEGVKLIHSRSDDLTASDAASARGFLDHANDLLGIVEPVHESHEPDAAPAGRDEDTEIDRLVRERDEARAERDFERADRIRDELADRGVEIMDTPDGTRWKRNASL